MTEACNEFLKILEDNKAGKATGICSVCSSQENVLHAAMAGAKEANSLVLVESTSNQVDQNGGYTGMKPADFVSYVHGLADELHFPKEKILLGGDHLGPNVWQGEPAEQAMEKAHVLIREYVKAGYQKIHLDASMFLADDEGDRHKPLADEIVAERAAALCETAEKTWKEFRSDQAPPVYIVGTEVPIPGGAQEEEEHVIPTAPDDVDTTIEVTKSAFLARDLGEAWERVCGVVVQPGVEFGDDQVFDYQPEQAKALSEKIKGYDRIVYEAHSTDYQTEDALTDLVRDHFCILKVGPWLTFAYREGIFALSQIEEELFGNQKEKLSSVRTVLEEVMLEHPKYWQKYYPGSEEEQAYKRKFSFSDRSRYYWPNEKVRKSVATLFSNLHEKGVPLSLLSQYMPEEFYKVRSGQVQNDPKSLVESKVGTVLGIYGRACGQ